MVNYKDSSAQPAGGCNHVSGLTAGGFNTPGTTATKFIDMIEIQTSGDAVNFGLFSILMLLMVALILTVD